MEEDLLLKHLLDGESLDASIGTIDSAFSNGGIDGIDHYNEQSIGTIESDGLERPPKPLPHDQERNLELCGSFDVFHEHHAGVMATVPAFEQRSVPRIPSYSIAASQTDIHDHDLHTAVEDDGGMDCCSTTSHGDDSDVESFAEGDHNGNNAATIRGSGSESIDLSKVMSLLSTSSAAKSMAIQKNDHHHHPFGIQQTGPSTGGIHDMSANSTSSSFEKYRPSLSHTHCQQSAMRNMPLGHQPIDFLGSSSAHQLGTFSVASFSATSSIGMIGPDKCIPSPFQHQPAPSKPDQIRARQRMSKYRFGQGVRRSHSNEKLQVMAASPNSHRATCARDADAVGCEATAAAEASDDNPKIQLRKSHSADRIRNLMSASAGAATSNSTTSGQEGNNQSWMAVQPVPPFVQNSSRVLGGRSSPVRSLRKAIRRSRSADRIVVARARSTEGALPVDRVPIVNHQFRRSIARSRSSEGLQTRKKAAKKVAPIFSPQTAAKATRSQSAGNVEFSGVNLSKVSASKLALLANSKPLPATSKPTSLKVLAST